jgi:hypothetical protein
MSEQFEPVDFNRCQAEVHITVPFALGGTHLIKRCPNRSVWLAVETKKNEDDRGAMSVCPSCKVKMIRQLKGKVQLFMLADVLEYAARRKKFKLIPRRIIEAIK